MADRNPAPADRSGDADPFVVGAAALSPGDAPDVEAAFDGLVRGSRATGWVLGLGAAALFPWWLWSGDEAAFFLVLLGCSAGGAFANLAVLVGALRFVRTGARGLSERPVFLLAIAQLVAATLLLALATGSFWSFHLVETPAEAARPWIDARTGDLILASIGAFVSGHALRVASVAWRWWWAD